jgi:Flp pilus assembly protein TadG
MRKTNGIWQSLRAFGRANGANVAMMFGLSLVPLAIAAGAGLDFARAMMERSAISDALDAATLAIGAKPGMSASNAQALAQNVFNANYKGQGSPTIGTPTISGQSVNLTATESMSTTLLVLVGKPTLNLSVGSTVVWGQTKLWVALVLDNTGSMTETDSTGTSKITALKNASNQLFTTLQSAAANQGDVEVSITPFAKVVNIGTSNVNATWLDWTDWQSEPYNDSRASVSLWVKLGIASPGPGTLGPGDNCPWSAGTDSISCVNQPNGSSTSTIPSSGTYKGYICPGPNQTYSAASGLGGHHFNGCYIATAAGATKQVSTGKNAVCTGYTNCSCTGSGSSKVCKANYYNYVWTPNSHSTWAGCLEDRNRNGDNGATSDFDTNNGAPTSAASSLFPATNDDNCPATVILPFPSTWAAGQWTTLSNTVNAMTANGSTNQTIGLAQGWQTMTNSLPYNSGALPANTAQYIILVTDGLNTMDRWYGDGSDQATQVDTRMLMACANAKAAGIIIYTIFVDLGGTTGNSSVLQSCATDASKYYDLTTSNAIVTTLNQIGQQITNLRVSN